MKHWLPPLIVTYAIVGIITFGHAHHSIQPPTTRPGAVQEGKVLGAALAAMLWPLYWSTVAWEKP